MLIVALTGMVLAAAPAPVHMILDTDIGDDIDDTWALCQALGTPEISLKLVVTAFQNTPEKTRLLAKILERAGRTDIPIGTGKKTGDNPINQQAWLGDYDLSGYPGKVHADGVQAMIDLIMAADGPITVCAIGPVTNLAEALRREPRIADKARVVLMAGSIHIGYEGHPGPQPEWNVRCDVAAFRAVLAAPWDITIAPLDSCGAFRLSGEDYLRVARSDAPAAKTVIENYDLWVNRKHHPENSSSILFDTVAVYLAHDTKWLELETLPLSVDDQGMTYIDPERGRPVHCALRWKDEAAFKAHLIGSLTGCKRD